MAEHTTIQLAETNTTENYTVYDSPDGDDQQEMVGTYITDTVAEQLGEFIEFELSEGDGDGLSLSQDKETSSFVVFSDDADAVEAAYISHEVLDEINAEADSTLNAQSRPSDEEAFNEALEAQTVSEDEEEQAAEALLAEESESDEAEADDSDEDEADPQDEAAAELVSDEEVGI